MSAPAAARRGAAGALSVGAIAFLAACGDDSVGGGSEAGPKVIAEGRDRRRALTFSNWPYYMDVRARSNTVARQFQKKYGTKVKYVEEINDNVEFFGKVRQQYAAGNSGGRDLSSSPTGWRRR